jgi:hypothetical protein
MLRTSLSQWSRFVFDAIEVIIDGIVVGSFSAFKIDGDWRLYKANSFDCI